MSNKFENSRLAKFVRDDIYDPFKQNRASLEVKWKANNTIWNGGVTEVWKEHQEDSEGWKSGITVDVAKQKANMATAMINQMAFKKNQLPIGLSAVGDFGLSGPEKEQVEDLLQDVRDYMQESSSITGAVREAKRGIRQCAKYGVNYFKYSIATHQDGQYVLAHDTFVESVVSQNYVAWESISVWDIFRDLETDDVQDGRGIIHRQILDPHELFQMKGGSFVIDEAVDYAIKQHQADGHAEKYQRADRHDEITISHKDIEYLECWVRVPRAYAMGFTQNLDLDREIEASGDEINVLVGLIGHIIVRFTPVEHGDRPFSRQCWEEDVDELDSIGVMDALEPYQNAISGSLREFEDNKKMSGNSMLGIKREQIYNQEDINPRPGLIFDLSEDCERASDAIVPIVVPDTGDGLHSHIALMMQFADDTSNMPREMMGQGGGSTDSVAEMNQIIARSSKYLLTVISNFDLVLSEFVNKSYMYMMSDPNLAHLHGNFKISALGFESFEKRAVKAQSMQQWMNMIAQSPELSQATNLKWFLKQYADTLDLDPDLATKSEEQLQQEQQAIMDQQQAAIDQQRSDPMYMLEIAERQAKIAESEAKNELNMLKAQIEMKKLDLEQQKLEKMPEAPIGGGVQFLAKGGEVDPTRVTVMGEQAIMEGSDQTNNEVYVDEDGYAKMITRKTTLGKGVGGEVIPINNNAEGEAMIDRINKEKYENIADSF